MSLTVDATHKWDKQPVAAPIKAAFSGQASLSPTDKEQAPPASFTFIAGPKQGDKGTIDLTQTGVRGIGKKTVEFTVAGSSVAFAGTYQTPYGNPKIRAPVGAVSCTGDLSGTWAVLSFGNPDFKITLDNLVAQMNAPATSKYVELVRPGQPFTLYGESQLQGVLNPSSGPPQTVRLRCHVATVVEVTRQPDLRPFGRGSSDDAAAPARPDDRPSLRRPAPIPDRADTCATSPSP